MTTAKFAAIREFLDDSMSSERDASLLYFLDGKFYLADGCSLERVKPKSIAYASEIDSDRIVIKLSYKHVASGDILSIDVTELDANRLLRLCRPNRIGLTLSSADLGKLTRSYYR
jgi:hypothetical protein